MTAVTHFLPAGRYAIARSSNASHPGLLQSVRRIARLWRARIQQRHALALLDERDRRDLGISSWDVQHELGKHFWQG